jgi:hypothetical protein
VRVELSAEAEAQALAIDAWWRENRLGAPQLFARELEMDALFVLAVWSAFRGTGPAL